MKISELIRSGKKMFSFEFFPPKDGEGEEKLFATVEKLKPLNPSFVSVTYGAMGTTRANTIRIVSKIKKEIGLEAVAHLTCVGHGPNEIEEILETLQDQGIENIMALRGDPPKDQPEFKPVPGGFRYGGELVGYIRRHPKFCRSFAIAVGGYPETHPECRDKQKDLEHLKRKVDAGADLVITQLFFDNRYYFDFVLRAQKAGIRVPVVPGIMPVTHGPQIQKFASMCGATIPQGMQDAIVRFGEDRASIEAYGVEFATRQCDELLRGGAPGLHFYTLNKSAATRQIYSNLGLAKQG